MATDTSPGASIKVRVPGPAPGLGSVQCGDCGAVFSRAEHLTRHKRSHTNERPFSCSDCGKSFSRVWVASSRCFPTICPAYPSLTTAKGCPDEAYSFPPRESAQPLPRWDLS